MSGAKRKRYSKKSYLTEAKKRFIKLDKCLEKLRLSGFLIQERAKWNVPENGFEIKSENNPLRSWEAETFVSDDFVTNWNKTVEKGLKIAGLSKDFYSNIENMIILDSVGTYGEDQFSKINIRADSTHLRNKKITEIYSSINPKTGKKYTASEALIKYDLPDNVIDGISERTYNDWVRRSVPKSSTAVRKIASEYTKKMSG